jgi:protoporphyrinogen oxidase
MIEKNSSISIIGGGIGGLYTAWKMSEKGFNVTIIEQQNFVGGFSSAIIHEGFKIDIGPHYITTPKNSELFVELKKLLNANNILEIPNIHDAYRTCFRGKISKKYPTLFETIKNNGKIFAIQGVWDLLFSKILNFNKKSFLSSEDYLISTYGNFLYKKWFIPYLHFSFGDNEVPLKTIIDRFPPFSLKKILSVIKKNNVSTILEQKIPSNNNQEYIHWYPKFGMGSIVNSLKNKIIENNGKIITGASVLSIEHKKKIISYSKNNEEFKQNADIIIYATPLNITKKWISKEKIKNHNKGKSIHSIISFIFVDAPKVFDGWVITVYDTDLPFFRIAQQNFLSDHVTPSNKSLLSVESKVTEGDYLWEISDKEYFKIIEKKLRESSILSDEKIEGFKNIKIPNLYSVNSKSNPKEESIKIIKKLNEFKNEFLLGTAELDVGRLASDDPHDKSHSKMSLGGIYVALSNADLLVKQIISKIQR